ncbi:hypothetical protein B5X24_HaOG205879 [Helicoverpa armigera]|nr:hypothetical protein B5X24_HaOG205879 [Helicoverpa armigera]
MERFAPANLSISVYLAFWPTSEDGQPKGRDGWTCILLTNSSRYISKIITRNKRTKQNKASASHAIEIYTSHTTISHLSREANEIFIYLSMRFSFYTRVMKK